MWSETFLVLIAGALVYSTNDQIQRQSTASSVNQEQEFSACHNIEGMSEARNLSDTLAAKANCHVLDSQLASISSPRKETVPLSLPSEELPLQKQSSRASENQSISPKEEYIQNLEQSLQSVVNQGGLLKKINLLVQCLNRKAISNGKHFSKYKQKNIDAVQILEEGMLFVSSLLQQLGDEFQPLLSIREDSTKWKPPHMTATCTMDDSFPSVPHDSNNKDIDTTVSKGMSTLAEQKCCTHFDRHRMNEPQNENRRKQITVSSKELGLWLYAIEKQYNSSCHRFLQGTLVSLYCQCSASSTTGYFTKVLTKSCCPTYHSVSLQTFDLCIHDLYIHGGVDYNTVVDDQGQDNDSDSDSKPNGNSEDEDDEHGNQQNSNDSAATGGSGSSAGSGDGNDDNNGSDRSNNGGNNIHEDDKDGDEDDEDDDENNVNDDNYPQLPVITETELLNIPKLVPIQLCEDIIVAPINEICGTQSCMVTGAIASTQNTVPTTECCSGVPLMRGQSIVPGIILNNPPVTCEHTENHFHQSEVLTSRERQGTEQFHVVGPVDEMDGFLQQDDSVPLHEPIQVCDEQSLVGACETFSCDGPFQEEEM